MMSFRSLDAATLVVLLGFIPTANAGIAFDPAARTATLTDSKQTLSLHLRFDGCCLIDSVSIFGRQVVAPQTGVCTAVKTGDVWHTTRDGIPSPEAKHDGSTLHISNIRFGPADFPVSEEWAFSVADDHIDWTVTRTYLASGQLQDTYFPGFDFADINTWTGGILDTGGVVWTKYLDTSVATYASHTGSVIFWNKDSQDCLKLTTSPALATRDITARFSHHPSGVLSANFWPSDTPLNPAHGLARFLADRQDVWQPVALIVDPGHPLTVTTTCSLAAMRYDTVSSLGTLKGIDGHAVRELLNTIGRYGVIDRGISGGNGWRSSFTCTHEPWLAEFGIPLGDDAYIANCARTLDEWKRVAISPEGRVLARWHCDDSDAMPGTFDAKSGYYEAQWGYMLDSQPSYAICVAEQFDMTGDLSWLQSHRDSCRAALEYMLKRDSDHDGLLEVIPQSCKEEKGSDWIDIVWASHENALVNAEMYEALTQWSALEDLMGDAAQASHFHDAAIKLKTAFNRSIDEGGFWNPQRNWYVYWREADGSFHGDNLVTPVNFAAIAYGICDDPVRRQAILGQIESLMQKEGLFHWPLCFFPFRPEEVHIRQKAFPVYENGDLFLSWAEVAIRAYVKTDPALAVKYIQKVIARYNVDGLSFQRCLRANAEGAGDDILAGNAMAIVGLYRDIYGVRPRHDRLFLEPHLTPELNGTQLFYSFRGTRYTIDLASDGYKIAANHASVASAQPFGVDLSTDQVRFFPTMDRPAELTVVSADHLPFDIVIDAWPTGATSSRHAWTVHSSSDASVSIRHIITGLPRNGVFKIRRDGEIVASPRSSPAGVIEFSVANIAKATRLSLEPESEAPPIVTPNAIGPT